MHFLFFKGNTHFMRKIPPGAEASNILVGEVDFLDKTLSAFIRLSQAGIMGDLTEVPVPTRFIFVLLGPTVSMPPWYRSSLSDFVYRSSERPANMISILQFRIISRIVGKQFRFSRNRKGHGDPDVGWSIPRRCLQSEKPKSSFSRGRRVLGRCYRAATWWMGSCDQDRTSCCNPFPGASHSHTFYFSFFQKVKPKFFVFICVEQEFLFPNSFDRTIKIRIRENGQRRKSLRKNLMKRLTSWSREKHRVFQELGNCSVVWWTISKERHPGTGRTSRTPWPSSVLHPLYFYTSLVYRL